MKKFLSCFNRFIRFIPKIVTEDIYFHRFLIILIFCLPFSHPLHTQKISDLNGNEMKNIKNDWVDRMEDVDDFELLDTCRQVAFILGYDGNKIDEAYYTKRLPPEELGRTKIWGNYDLIVVNRDIKRESKTYQLANIIHEVVHVYTDSIPEWREEMLKAINYFPECKEIIKNDVKYDHRD